MARKAKRIVYNGPARELVIDFRGTKVELPKGKAVKVTDDQYEYLKCCQKKLNVIPVEEWEDSHKKRLRERMLQEG